MNVGLVEVGGRLILSPKHMCKGTAVYTYCTRVALLWDWGIPAAVTERRVPRLHRVAVGSVGSDRAFRSASLAALDGSELMLFGARRCPGWDLTSCRYQHWGFDWEIPILFHT